eukprot:2211081-Ditylum_brightwellii.AAC.1
MRKVSFSPTILHALRTPPYQMGVSTNPPDPPWLPSCSSNCSIHLCPTLATKLNPTNSLHQPSSTNQDDSNSSDSFESYMIAIEHLQDTISQNSCQLAIHWIIHELLSTIDTTPAHKTVPSAPYMTGRFAYASAVLLCPDCLVSPGPGPSLAMFAPSALSPSDATTCFHQLQLADLPLYTLPSLSWPTCPAFLPLEPLQPP